MKKEALAGVKLIIRSADKKFILIKRADSKKWDFPGGGIDEHEEVKDAAIREFEEETGLCIEDIGVDEISLESEYIQFNEKKLYTFYGESVYTSEDIKKSIPENIRDVSEGETEELRLFTALEIFRMRKNEVFELSGEKIQWGNFKIFLKLLDSKSRDDSELLREKFSDGSLYNPYKFLGETKGEKNTNSKLIDNKKRLR